MDLPPFPTPRDPTLIIATSGEEARLALLLPGGAIAHSPALAQDARGRDLVPAARDLVASVGLRPTDLGTVVVDIGPGSFTGIRLGVTLAKTLAFAAGARLLSVTSLEALAAAATRDSAVVALVEAGRGTWYGARFGAVGATGFRPTLVEPARRPAAAWREDASDSVWIGERLERFPAAADPRTWGAHAAVSHVLEPRDLLAARPDLAVAPGLSPHGLRPRYLQASAPERAARGEP